MRSWAWCVQEQDSGLITGISQLTTSAFALHASRALADTGTLRISLSAAASGGAWPGIAQRARGAYQGR